MRCAPSAGARVPWMMGLAITLSSCAQVISYSEYEYGLKSTGGPALTQRPAAMSVSPGAGADAMLKPRTLTRLSAAAPRIVIDPGHGGKDPGACAHGLQEKQLTFAISVKLYRMLKASGASCTMTRWDDRFQSLAQRVQIADNFQADLFVSVHINAAESPQAEGAEILYRGTAVKGAKASHLQQSRQVADRLAGSLGDLPGLKMRGVKADTRHLFVLKQAHHPAVLAELGFITNAGEAQRLKREDYQEDLAYALYQGLVAVIAANPPRR